VVSGLPPLQGEGEGPNKRLFGSPV
jgi:hypothetical protein